MTYLKLVEVFMRYDQALNALAVPAVECPESPLSLHHLHYMLRTALTWPETRKEKGMRWLGFIQAGLIAAGVYTLEDVKHHSMP